MRFRALLIWVRQILKLMHKTFDKVVGDDAHEGAGDADVAAHGVLGDDDAIVPPWAVYFVSFRQPETRNQT